MQLLHQTVTEILYSACYFNGVNQFINLPFSSVLKPQLPITYSCWVNFDVIDPAKTVMMTNDFDIDNHAGAWINTSSTGNFAANYGDNTGNTSSPNRRTKVGATSLNAGQWYHLVAVIRGPSDMDLYVDCRNDLGSYSGSGGMIAYSSAVGSIGRKDATVGATELYYQGYIDDFRFWNRALTQHEVDNLCLFTLDVEENTFLEGFVFTVFPNPASNKLFFNVSDENNVKLIQLVNSAGAIVKETFYSSEMDIQGIEKGLYFIRALSKNNQILDVQKVIIN